MYLCIRGKGGGMVILVRDELLVYFLVCKYVGDSMVWVKLLGIYKNDVYICFVYIVYENSVFYIIYDIDFFDILLCDIVKYSDMGVIILVGDFNSCVGELKDYVEYDILVNNLLNNMFVFLLYDKDYICLCRLEDKYVNNFGCKLFELC